MFKETRLNIKAADIVVLQKIRKSVIIGETSEFTGMLSETIWHKKVSVKKASIARAIRSPERGGEPKVTMDKRVSTRLGMMTLYR